MGREDDSPRKGQDMGQTRAEQETTIRWDEADQVMTVYSASPPRGRARCSDHCFLAETARLPPGSVRIHPGLVAIV